MNFSDLPTGLSSETVKEIRRKGTVVIRDVVDDADASRWKQMLDEHIQANPDVEGE